MAVKCFAHRRCTLDERLAVVGEVDPAVENEGGDWPAERVQGLAGIEKPLPWQARGGFTDSGEDMGGLVTVC